jgi:hypothetical protein
MNEDDHQAAVIYTKVSERRMTMLGGNDPHAYSVHLTHSVVPAQTSTDKLRAALARLNGTSLEPPSPEEQSKTH